MCCGRRRWRSQHSSNSDRARGGADRDATLVPRRHRIQALEPVTQGIERAGCSQRGCTGDGVLLGCLKSIFNGFILGHVLMMRHATPFRQDMSRRAHNDCMGCTRCGHEYHMHTLGAEHRCRMRIAYEWDEERKVFNKLAPCKCCGWRGAVPRSAACPHEYVRYAPSTCVHCGHVRSSSEQR